MEKEELLKTIAIESVKQVVAEASPSPKRRRKCTQDKILPDYRRKEINNIPMREVTSGGYWQVIFQPRQFKALSVIIKFLTFLNIPICMSMVLPEYASHKQTDMHF